MIIKYVIPLWYFHRTRLSSVFQKISWMGVYWVPSLLMPVLIFKENIISVVIIILGINYIYENGYIQNDIYAVANEKKPTERILIEERDWFRNNVFLITGMRIGILALLLVFLYISTLDMNVLLALVSILTLLQACYFIYNSVRNKWVKHFLIIPLSWIRFYGSLLVLFLLKTYESQSLLMLLLFGFILYPFEKWIEFGKKHGAFWGKHIRDIDQFRMYYYITSSIILLALSFFIDTKIIKVYAALSLYYLVLRIFTNYLSKRLAKQLNRQSWTDE